MTYPKRFMALVVFPAALIYAQDISGDWQGTLKLGPRELRTILQVTKGESGEWKAVFLSIDQSPDRGVGMTTTSFSLDRAHIKFAISQIHGSYDGTVSTDGKTITGTFTQGLSLPLEFRRATKETAWRDPSPHRVQFIPVERNVTLEVLDWGGSGKPLVLLAGLGNSAHVFDKFAPKLTAKYHVYGITRRGFGASSAPLTLRGRDVFGRSPRRRCFAVLDALKLNRPVLAGHSIAGEELSSVGSRHPDRVVGADISARPDIPMHTTTGRGVISGSICRPAKKAGAVGAGEESGESRQLIEELLATALPGFERDLGRRREIWLESPPCSSQRLSFHRLLKRSWRACRE